MWDDENDMDELLLKAARDYPLKRAADGWESIVPLLKQEATGSIFVKKNNGSRRNSALLAMLLTVLLFFGLATNDSVNKCPSVMNVNIKNEKRAGNAAMINITAKIIKGHAAVKVTKYNKQVKDGQLFTSLLPENETIMTPDTANEKPNQNSRLNGLDAATNRKIETLPAAVAATIPFINTKKQLRGMYLGLVAGPSFNQVKGQGLNKDGYDIGLIAGYQLNNKLSVESGLLFEKKYYFTDGKYFDMSKASGGMPAGMQVLSLQGSRAIFEIPLKLKYDFAASHHTLFFASAGISTYIVTNEFNKYRAVINGAQQEVTGEYKNMSNYFAAAVQVSGGYQRKIGKLITLRIEPYLQIPARGIGVGSLAVLSTGIHLGITIPGIR